jgi:hypothetical protein
MKLQEKLIGKFDITDIDIEYNYSDELDESGDQIRLDIKYSDEVSYSECPPAKIDEVIKNLILLKEKGAERVYISEHIDHHGYYFYGVKLEEYIPIKRYGWKCIKDFPGGKEGDVYIFDAKYNRYYTHPYEAKWTNFSDYAKYPEFYQKVEMGI